MCPLPSPHQFCVSTKTGRVPGQEHAHGHLAHVSLGAAGALRTAGDRVIPRTRRRCASGPSSCSRAVGDRVRRSVWCPVPGGRSQLFVEPVPATGRVHHDDLARLIGQVQERVGDLRWQVGKAALIELEELVADPDLEAPRQDMDRLLLLVVHVQRGSAFRRDFDCEVVKGAAGVLSGDLEDEVSSRARLQPQAFVWRQNRVYSGGGRHCASPHIDVGR